MSKEEVLHVVIDSAPSTEVSWINILTALLTIVIALIAAYIAYQQYTVNKQRLRHETYERRLHVYKVVQKYLSEILRDGKTTYDGCVKFYSEASEAAFLFDDSVQKRIDEIYQRSVKMVGLYEQMYPSDGSPGLAVGEDRSRLVKQNSELLKWHIDQLKESKTFFSTKLGLKNT